MGHLPFWSSIVKPNPLNLLVVALTAFTLAGCAAAPRARPIPTTRIDESNTVQAVRKQLEGTWTLVSLEFAAEDGRRATVQADGQLRSDAFGNLHVEYRLSDRGQVALEGLGFRTPNPVISTDGQVAIDTQQHRITYIPPDAATRAFDPDLAARRASPFALETPRYYSIGDDGILTLTTRHASGKDAATSRWKKNP
jgi:hypothetical protein